MELKLFAAYDDDAIMMEGMTFTVGKFLLPLL